MKVVLTSVFCTIMLCAALYIIAQQFRDDNQKRFDESEKYYYYDGGTFIFRIDKETGEHYKAKQPFGWLKIE